MFVIGDKYHVVSTLGSGGMGAVYEALHARTGRRVAVKMLRGDIAAGERARERFVKEARIAGSLESPNVAAVLDAGTDEASGLPYIVMELLEGPSLRDVLKERGRLPVGVVCVIAAQVARGLGDAHAAGVIHRDVKPANVMLCRDRDDALVAKLVDFGVAKALGDDDAALTKTGDFVGSLPYMAPEQLMGKTVDAATDVWSLGVVMYEALTATRPTGNDEPLAMIVRRVCEHDIEDVSDVAPWVPRAVGAIVRQALNRDPKRRPSAHALERGLLALLPAGVHAPIAALDVGGPVVAIVTPREARRGVSGPAVMVAAAIGVACVGGVMVTRERNAATEAPAVASTPTHAPAPPPRPMLAPAAPADPAGTTIDLGDDPGAPSTASSANRKVPRSRPRVTAPASSAATPRTAPHDPLDHM